MIFRSLQRRRHVCPRPSSAAGLEVLEARQLLSGTNGVSSGRELTVSAEMPAGSRITIERIDQVGGELWLAARLTDSGEADNTETVTASVTVDAPDLPVRYFQVGAPDVSIDSAVTKLDSLADYHAALAAENSVNVFSREDLQLADWRAAVERKMIAEADSKFSDEYGRPVVGFDDWRLINEPVYFYSLAAADVATDSTNVQVGGVDEADIVETDGQYLYTMSNQEIVIVRAATADSPAEVVSRTSLPDLPTAMFLQGDRLTVISQQNQFVPIYDRIGILPAFDLAMPAWNQPIRTVVSVLDISDRAAPVLQQETIIDGEFASARAIGDQVYVVVNNRNAAPTLPWLGTTRSSDNQIVSQLSATRQTRTQYLQTLAEVIHGSDTSDGVAPPAIWRRSTDGEEGLQKLGWLNGAPDDVPINGGQLISVLQFDISSPAPEPVSNVGYFSETFNNVEVYASQTALYLTTDWYSAGGTDAEVNAWTTSTVIHKVGLTSDGLVDEGSGQVPGSVDDQFSMDEFNGHLRIVTNGFSAADTVQSSSVYVLEDSGAVLSVVGSITGIAPTENVYSVRFDGDRAWIVTFRRVDPVFSLDLSDPQNPVITGELKIPGYSDYLQLIDENHLLAIGRDADSEGRVTDLQVSLFDVSDMTQPTLLHKYNLAVDAWASSEALSNHLAFNYIPETHQLAIPVSSSSGQQLVILNIDITDGISLAGSVGSTGSGLFLWNQGSEIRRSVRIDDLLYVVSTNSIQIVRLDDLSPVQKISLNADTVPICDLNKLLPVFPEIVGRAVRLREKRDIGGLLSQVELLVDEALAGISRQAIAEFEFRVLDSDGAVLLTWTSSDPVIQLTPEQQQLLGVGTYRVQFRTKSGRLANAEFGAWSEPQAISISSDTVTLLSGNTLTMNNRQLRWSQISDRIQQVAGQATDTVRNVSSYELWISDQATSRRVQYERNLTDTFQNLDLVPGSYWAWVRAVFDDGSLGPWSRRNAFSILGQQIPILTQLTATLETQPEIEWQQIADAVSFEIEVTDADGVQTVYTATDLIETRHTIANSLQPGTYSVRVRAQLASGVPTEWSQPLTFTVVARPVPQLSGQTLSWNGLGAATSEVWVSLAGQRERLSGIATSFVGQVSNVLSDLNLDPSQDYDVWVRNILPDGSKSAWSPRTAINLALAGSVAVHSLPQVSVGDQLTVSWDAANGADSYEVYVSKDGQLLLRQAGIQDTAFTLPEALTAGSYSVWVRAQSAAGRLSGWGERLRTTVRESLQLNLSDSGILSWTADPLATRYELWVNEINSLTGQVTPRILHLTDLTETSYDLSSLDGKQLKVWVRSIQESGSAIKRTPWSFQAINDVVQSSQLGDTINNVVNNINHIIEDVLSNL
ncbi:MAG: beta-propeller domain-containing protein [Planctomycetaceae bacterium]